jgi:hypothetical protein
VAVAGVGSTLLHACWNAVISLRHCKAQEASTGHELGRKFGGQQRVWLKATMAKGRPAVAGRRPTFSLSPLLSFRQR